MYNLQEILKETVTDFRNNVIPIRYLVNPMNIPIEEESIAHLFNIEQNPVNIEEILGTGKPYKEKYVIIHGGKNVLYLSNEVTLEYNLETDTIIYKKQVRLYRPIDLDRDIRCMKLLVKEAPMSPWEVAIKEDAVNKYLMNLENLISLTNGKFFNFIKVGQNFYLIDRNLDNTGFIILSEINGKAYTHDTKDPSKVEEVNPMLIPFHKNVRELVYGSVNVLIEYTGFPRIWRSDTLAEWFLLTSTNSSKTMVGADFIIYNIFINTFLLVNIEERTVECYYYQRITGSKPRMDKIDLNKQFTVDDIILPSLADIETEPKKLYISKENINTRVRIASVKEPVKELIYCKEDKTFYKFMGLGKNTLVSLKLDNNLLYFNEIVDKSVDGKLKGTIEALAKSIVYRLDLPHDFFNEDIPKNERIKLKLESMPVYLFDKDKLSDKFFKQLVERKHFSRDRLIRDMLDIAGEQIVVYEVGYLHFKYNSIYYRIKLTKEKIILTASGYDGCYSKPRAGIIPFILDEEDIRTTYVKLQHQVTGEKKSGEYYSSHIHLDLDKEIQSIEHSKYVIDRISYEDKAYMRYCPRFSVVQEYHGMLLRIDLTEMPPDDKSSDQKNNYNYYFRIYDCESGDELNIDSDAVVYDKVKAKELIEKIKSMCNSTSDVKSF